VKKVYYIIIMLIFLPSIVLASPNATLSTNTSTIENGSAVTATVTLTDTAAWNIKIVGSGAATCSSKQADVTSDGKSTTKNFTLSCTSTSEGTINFQVTGDITSGSGDTKDISLSKSVKVTKPKSNVNTLSDLKVNGNTISGFNSSKTSYSLNNNDASINITAIATDTKATIQGIGSKNLKYGKNIFNIVVVAENGSKKTYTLVVNKEDSRNSNNYLNSLSVSEGKIDFDKNITNYTLKLEHNINEITINAVAEDSKSSISGLGKKELVDYVNEFKIIVTAENGSSKTYTLKILRKDSLGNYGKLSDDASVKDITIDNYDFKFDKDIKKYNIIVENINEIKINVIPNDQNATVDVINNTNLKVGLNEVKVKVTAENGNLNEYLFNVYKIGEETKEEINIKKDYTWMIISLIEFVFIVTLLITLYRKNNV